MAVQLNQQDLSFILRQIRIAEAHASGIDLTELRVDPATGNLLSDRNLYDAGGVWTGDPAAPQAIPDPHTPYGLRTVDGTFNNIVPGRETWGSAGQPMPQLLDRTFVNERDDVPFDANGPGPGGIVDNNDYGSGQSVVDADPRLISNLVVDASLGNPAAIAAALRLAGSETVIDDQRAITAAYEALRAVEVADPTPEQAVELATRRTALGTLLDLKGITVTDGSIDNLNVAPDEGLSKPFNAWMTFFGQFFDHGLDLISKGGNGTVYIPLAADDPLVTHGADGIAGSGDEVGPQQQFMVLTRSTPVDGSQRNVTTPFVDQNQTYTSNPSHQVFLREYALEDGRPVATGRLLGGANDGLATWADVKEQARSILGIDLRDSDVSAVPQLLTDPYGAFVPGVDGLPQVMAGIGVDGSPVYASGTLAAPLVLSAIQLPPGTVVMGAGGVPNTIEAGETVGAARTFNAFLDDIAHNAVPVLTGGVLVPDVDTDTGNAVGVNQQTGRNLAYDNELLDRHYATGDGRGNENIGLTAVHHIFHSEHNRQVDAHKLTILRDGDLAFVNQWLDAPITEATLGSIKASLNAVIGQDAVVASLEDGNAQTGIAGVELNWNGERLFQAGRFATEMQYQHLVFEEFARKVQPQIDVFVFNSVTEINPAIFAEFANTVYRFGHSMLTENMPRVGADGQAIDGKLGLIEAFLNPVLFTDPGDNAAAGAADLSDDEAAAAIIRGMTVERGSEIDEFIVGAVRNNLLGLPLDLAAINIARGRDTGTPTLNEAREQLYAATGSTFLTPYANWVELAANLKNSMSVVNFIAAYGTHGTITGAETSEARRDAAMALVFGGVGAPDDRLDFLNATGAYAPDGGGMGDDSHGGLDNIDLWVGGLAEKQMPFGGLLGSTFNAVFEAQMENLQDADRFYYLTRTQGQNFLVQLEQNSFSKLMLANTSLSQPGPDGIRGTGDDIVTRHIGIDAFADYDFELEVNAANQADQNGGAAGIDPTGNDLVLEAMGLGKVMRGDPGTPGTEVNYLRFTGGEHVLAGGTNGNDTIVTDFGDDAIWGDAGNDRIESGAGVDLVNGGDGDDIITDSGDTGDFLKGEGGNDVIANSNGVDILMGGTGKDVVFVGVDATEVFAGAGDDFVLGGDGTDLLMGNEGDDWLEAGGGFDTTAGDNSELFFNSAIKGHDVMFAGGDEHDFDGESGDDIMVQGESVMRNEGMFGFDWAIFKGNARDAHADMNIPIFTTEEADILRNRFDSTEALSGWENDDTLIGDSRTAADGLAEEPGGATVAANEGVFFNDGLDQAGINRIAGLGQIVSVGANGVFEAGNILLGGAGSDLLQGNGGDDILDGDRWLNVRISIRGGANGNGQEIATVDSLKHVFAAGELDSQDQPIPSAWEGKSLFELMVARTIRPDQMQIVREVVTTGAATDDVDTAVFNDVRGNYSITRVGNALRVEHVTFTDPAVDDGTDTLRNIETLRFADGPVSVALVRNQPFDALTITESDATGNSGTLLATLVNPAPNRAVTLQWQTLDANGEWSDVPNATGNTFTPDPLAASAEIRVLAKWTTTGTLGSSEQTTASVRTAFVGTVNDEDIDGSTSSNVMVGRAGDDDIAGDNGNDRLLGGGGDDRLDGGAGDDALFGNAGADILIGRTGNNTLDGGAGDDELSGGHGDDIIDGGAGVADAMLASGDVGSYHFVRTANTITVTDDLGLEGDGRDIVTNVELFQDDGGAILNLLTGNNGSADADIVIGNGNGTSLAGGAGNDFVFGNGGSDTVIWNTGDGRDVVDGGLDGASGDTFVVNGQAGVTETFAIYTRAAWGAAGNGLGGLNASTEIVVTRSTLADGTSVIAELRDIEELVVGLRPLTQGTPPTNGSTPAGDIVEVHGDFTGTSLALSTITVEGTSGNDTVDITGLTSAHRIVFRSNGGNDTVVGTLREQDVIELAPGATVGDYASTTVNGMTTLSNGTHAITFASSGTPTFATVPAPAAGGAGGGTGVVGAFMLTAADLAGIENLVQGRPAVDGDDDTEDAAGVRSLSGAGNNLDNPEFGAADQPFIRLTDAHYGAYDPATGNNALNPLYAGLDPRAISNVLGTQEADLPHEANGSNIFFMAFGQYFDHGLDFLPKSATNGTVLIDQPGSGRAPGTNNPADLTRGEVSSIVDGVPQHLNKTSPYVDQNQAYGSHALVGQFLRESDGNQGVGVHLLAGVPDPSNPAFNLLPTLRELIQHHWDADTIFHDASLPGGAVSFRTYFSNFPISDTKTGSLFNAAGAYDPEAVSAFASNFMGSGNALLLDTNPFVSLLDHYVAGDGRANENVSLTAMHTIWARNHNFHVENLVEAGFQGTPEEVFQAAKMINEAEYQRVVFDEFADQLIGGMKGGGTHGHSGYNPDVDARISHEFASAVYRVGHSLIGETLTVIGSDGQPRQVALFDAFLNPSNAPDVFTAPLPPSYVPQPGYAQLGANAILAGVATQPAEEVDFNIVDAVRNDLVRINADLFAFNVARGRDVGLGTLNQVRADLQASADPYIHEAVGFAGDLSPYTSWADFQARNGLSDTVIAQFKQAYPDLVLVTPTERTAFVAANPDIEIHQRADGKEYVSGIDRIDLWVGGLAEQHVNGGVVSQTFWVVLHEQFDRLQEGDRFYYTDRFDNFDFYQNIVDGQNFSDIVARNTGLTGLQEDIFAVSDEDQPDASGDGGTVGGVPGDTVDDDDDAGEDDDDDTTGSVDTDDETGAGTGTGGTPTGGGDDTDDGEGDADAEVDDGPRSGTGNGTGGTGTGSGGTTGGGSGTGSGAGAGTGGTPDVGDDDSDDEDDDTVADNDDDGPTGTEDSGDDEGEGTVTPGGGTTGGGTAGGDGTGGGTIPPVVPETTPRLVAGTANDDVLVGTDGADTVLGLGGDDNVLSGEGADVVRGGDGNDFVDAGGGRDVVFGGAGADDILAGGGDDMVYGDGGADRILAGAGNDLVTAGAGNDAVIGGDGNDLFVAEVGDGDDSYWGDEVGGGTGSDTLDMSAITANITANLGTGLAGRGSVASGQSGSDTLWGVENVVTGSGADHITASDATNVMDGGLGADTYHFQSAAAANGDTIASFQPGDRVDLSGIDANQGAAGNQAFTLATGAAFTGVGQLLVTQESRADGDYTVVAGNTGGDAAPEFKFAIKGTPAATAADFAL
ncbi:calcium-binding protein [Methylobacterium sp. WL103]|uniref:peroxidase family protein n=1 Tax=Methylobacterium sp. WL103 TaxID=2603891 RepID=UPI0011C9F69C|nr:peroxidase family protein [Methylobacterium sp. WL103]TXN09141.1 calcium-binding protein [Methylobacterium sp. WL103]